MAEIKQLKEKKTDEIFYPVTVGEAVIFEDGTNLKDKIDQINNCIETTHSELKSLRDNSELIPGHFYRITDYVTTTTDSESRSAGHPFDILVFALDNAHLSEEAYATQHEGDTYFANSNLHAWKLRYCIDNDNTRFNWANTNYGKGVIYRMIDEFDNDLPFDFKNIQFKRYRVSDVNIKENGVTNELAAQYIGAYAGLSISLNKFVFDTADYKWYYPFTRLGSTWSSEILDDTVVSRPSSRNIVLPNTSGEVRSLNNVVFAMGPCLQPTCLAVYEDAVAMHNCFIREGSTQLSIFGGGFNFQTGTQFRRSIYLGPLRHSIIGSDVQDNEICTASDFAFNFISDGFINNTIISRDAVSYDFFGYGSRLNTIVASRFTNNVFLGYFYRNTIISSNCRLNYFNRVQDCTFNGALTVNNIDGTLIYSSFRNMISCKQSGLVQHVTADFEDTSLRFCGVNLIGPIAGSSSEKIKLDHQAFTTHNGPNSTGRCVMVEGNNDGEIIATWKGAHGITEGIYATPAETNAGTWHNITT